MRDRDAERLDRQVDRIFNELPSVAGGFLRWLRGSSSRWVRVPFGLLLIIFGVFGFLPVLGFWRKTSPSFDDRYCGRWSGWKENGLNGSIEPGHNWPRSFGRTRPKLMLVNRSCAGILSVSP